MEQENSATTIQWTESQFQKATLISGEWVQSIFPQHNFVCIEGNHSSLYLCPLSSHCDAWNEKNTVSCAHVIMYDDATDPNHSNSVIISNLLSLLQHAFQALFDSITSQCKGTNYLISGRWQTDGTICQKLVDGVTASWRFLFLHCDNNRMAVVSDT